MTKNIGLDNLGFKVMTRQTLSGFFFVETAKCQARSAQNEGCVWHHKVNEVKLHA